MLKLATVFHVKRTIDLRAMGRGTTGMSSLNIKKNKEGMNLVAVPCRALYFDETHEHRYERNDKLKCA